MKKKLLFSVTIKDCVVQAFRGPGAGGQAKNKTSSAIRVIHEPSGARGQSSEAREQHINKRTAFLRMIETKEFRAWVKRKTSQEVDLEQQVEQEMHPKNIKAESMDNGVWVPYHEKESVE